MSKEEPCLFHVNHGPHHVVAAQLRVLICPDDGGGFVAQGLEIDYCATGSSIEQVQERFATGLLRTAETLVKRGRDLSAMFKSKTPPEIWSEYIGLQADDQHHLTCATVLEYEPSAVPAGMPFTKLAFCNSLQVAPHA